MAEHLSSQGFNPDMEKERKEKTVGRVEKEKKYLKKNVKIHFKQKYKEIRKT